MTYKTILGKALTDCCPSCLGEDEIEYLGISDGGGDWGGAVCDCFVCRACGYEWEDNCLGEEEYPEEDEDES